ncbi:hypothetical protein NPIL_628751 [Nephila pilipes]|uniref:ATPase AAA-type core domain-containing protein n=1 Tax=Nephila pilipes TaxID=299642 RepID=A0A8X6JMV1_NEPPI|nr:hypothetical protein NPIL_628751 [Nephila pilipes]
MNSLLQIPSLKNVRDPMLWRKFFDPVQAEVRNLESLEINSDSCGKTGYLQKEKKSVENKNIKNQLNVRNFFQVKSPSSTKPLKDQESKISVDKLNCTSSSFPGENHNSTSCSISTQTIILFDDIDVVFQEDEGLWSTIRGFLRISKKPVIFTVSRNLAIVKANLDADIKVLNLKPMIQDLVIEKLSNQYEKHYRKNTNMNIKLLVNNCNDVRRSLLHGQFWSQQCIIPSHVESSGELLSTNTFLLGSMDFSASDFISFLFKNCTLEFSNILSHYHGIGYDVLHSNIFTIFNVILEFEVTRSWQSVIRKHEHPCNNIVEINTESESDNCIQTDLRQEAYKISKEHTLQKNSLNDLFVFSNIFDDFSFIDILKGHFCRSMKWISLPDRIKKWTLGLPVCSEEDYFYLDDIILEVSSLIQLLRLQHAQNKYFYKYDSKLNKIQTLILEHPIVSFDYVNGHKVQMQIENIASVFSASSLLNKTVLNLDYLSTLKIICQEELLRRAKSGKRCNRFLHYFDSISLFVDKYQIEQLLD